MKKLNQAEVLYNHNKHNTVLKISEEQQKEEKKEACSLSFKGSPK